ncbi:hypothetical protein [Pseudonocardia alni]|uniref:hypothetical protein n=1 Tax=Pseudonocardia alni TaxID=33907 RepID=UPI00280A6E5D|nr:hypothetical protein [Pseudonocardia alni]
MNRYGRQALEHWQTHLPNRFAQIENPQQHFTTLGSEVQDEIEALAAELAAQEGPAGSYLEQVGRLNRIQDQAAEKILAERVLLPPEADAPAPSESPR